ncbi:hypothetical protein E4U43_006241 [Claviceps pusilla]|uniref:Methyltransferase domain-containing protein n=1 Tax=Claviceps pusilla TaxID=123648 RepID=A0A9P7NFW0_9HYPO|nr:hypothetical protein E4U43_006241 [Claviceps pusilla]
MDIVALQKWAYIPDLPDDIGPIRTFLHEYSKIPAADIDHHILRAREDAWNSSRFPCIGRWKFLRLAEQNDPYYQQVLFRLKLNGSSDAFLDLGCCVGVVLRQLRHDGVEGSQLFGIDLHAKFLDIGYDLFQDQDSLGATFVVGDMLDPEDTRLDVMLGKVTIIYAGSFFHLFNWNQQLCVGQRLVGFLKDGTKNALIYGRQMGTRKPGERAIGNASPPYLHDKHSFQRLWREIGDLTKTNWVVDLEPADVVLEGLAQHDKDVEPVNFMVHQIC